MSININSVNPSNPQNLHYLAITALGKDHLGILEAFTKVSKQCGCNIIESKMSKFGEECALLIYLTGSWNTVAKLEAALPPIAQQYSFLLQTKRTLPHIPCNALPYHVQVIAQDRAGILNELAQFFTQAGISVEQMNCETYRVRNHTMMVSITFLINIPVKQHLATIRERFMVYCEDRNLDAVIEPDKNAVL